ncbi:MAG TPA: distal tail protein Dit [Methanosarcinales archaeon]|nr:distal tail protein Dit [Methanosarcinales archaeon]
MKGIVFNGKHSFTDFGLVMISKNRPILPEPKLAFEELPGCDGEYDYSGFNPDGRIKYKAIVFEVEFAFRQISMADVRTKAHAIAAWLSCGDRQLSFDDDPNKYWIGKVVNKLDLENLLTSVRRFTVQFKCSPFAYSTQVFNQEFVINGPTDIAINNLGTYVRPIIDIEGSFTNIVFSANGKTLTYNAAIIDAVLEIDFEQMIAVKDGAINVNNNLFGSFLELVSGSNTLQISGTDLNCTATISFRYVYL